MNQNENSNDNNLKKILERIETLETRLTKIEKKINYKSVFDKSEIELDSIQDEKTISQEVVIEEEYDETSLESSIGEKGLAFLGSLVLLFGIIFLMSFLQNKGFAIGSSLLGYASAGIVFFVAYKLKENFVQMNYLFNLSSLFLVYFTTLRLYFFTESPLIESKGFVVFLLVVVLLGQIYFSIKSKSQFIGIFALVLMILTGLFIDQTHITLSIFVLSVICSVYLFYKYAWYNLQFLVLFLVYFAHALWLFGNPVMGNAFEQVAMHQNNMIYLFSYASIFSLMALVPQKGLFHDRIYLITILFNGFIFSIVLMIDIFMFYKESYANIFLVISFACLIYSTILFNRKEREYAPPLYANYGFMALSIALFGYLNLPNIYYMLALQSLLVVSVALWFRSRIIVIANTFLFTGILLIYMLSSEAIGTISLVFAFVALASARIMNWQKERLTLQTELLRILYLIAAFISVLYGLYHAVPPKYVSLSWTIAAAIYFILSILLKNAKYRWMAIFTFIVTVFYLFFVDLAKMGVGYRVVAFLFIAVILIAVSLYYTKKLKKKSE